MENLPIILSSIVAVVAVLVPIITKIISNAHIVKLKKIEDKKDVRELYLDFFSTYENWKITKNEETLKNLICLCTKAELLTQQHDNKSSFRLLTSQLSSNEVLNLQEIEAVTIALKKNLTSELKNIF